MKKIIVAIDGYSSCGKSTMAKTLAKKLGYIYLDTGAMYRAATLFIIKHGLTDYLTLLSDKELDRIHISFQHNPQTGEVETYLNDENVEQQIRSMRVSQWVSKVSAIPRVRKKLVAQQQEIGKEKGIVVDGRDIGTKVFPNAELKIFLTASPQIRAKRRYDELKAKGEEISLEEIEKNIIQRDQLDLTRKESPLVQAEDAILLDNSNMTIEEQTQWLERAVEKVMKE